MSKEIKYSLIGCFILGIALAILCQFGVNGAELADMLTIVSFPLIVFIAVLALIIYYKLSSDN